MLSFKDSWDKGHQGGRGQELTVWAGAGVLQRQGAAGAGLLLPFPGIFWPPASAGSGIVTVLGIFLLF